MKKTVLISGVCGFIGSNLAEFLVKKKYKVIGIDNLSSGLFKNICNIIDATNFQFIEFDIVNKLNLKIKIDFIFHLASLASPKFYFSKPLETLRTGSIGSENMLELALYNKARILLASTSEVYGDPQEHPQKETYFGNVNPIGKRSVYDESKRYMESIATTYYNEYNVDIKIARIFNTYGPKMRVDDGRALPTFLNQGKNNIPYSVFGDGNQTRSFCYIDDTINGLYKLIYSDFNKPINIGNPFEISINDLIKKINKILKVDNQTNFMEIHENDPKKRKPDISLAIKKLKWKPIISLDEGIKLTLNHYEKKK